jgi:hypothetical protein
MTEPVDEEMVEVDPELARQAAIKLQGLEAVTPQKPPSKRGLRRRKPRSHIRDAADVGIDLGL